MENTPLLICFSSLAIWLFAAVFVYPKTKTAYPWVSILFSVIFLGCSIWSAVLFFRLGDLNTLIKSTQTMVSLQWLLNSNETPFVLLFELNSMTVILWIITGIVSSLFSYYSLIKVNEGKQLEFGEAFGLPMLSTMALVTIVSGDLISFYFGTLLSSVGAYFTFVFSRGSNQKAVLSSYRYFITLLLSECFLLGGLISIYSKYQTLHFLELYSLCLQNPPGILTLASIVGYAMFRCFQFPFMQPSREVAFNGYLFQLPMFFGHLLFVAVFITKFFPFIVQSSEVQWLATLPAITVLAAGFFALAEKKSEHVLGWVVTYLNAAVFLTVINGSLSASFTSAISNIWIFLLFAGTVAFLEKRDVSARWFIVLCAISFAGVPILSAGWARYLEYLPYYAVEEKIAALHWVCTVCKVLADMMISLAFWGLMRDYWRDKYQSKINWHVIVPLLFVALFCFSFAIGGRPLGIIGSKSILEKLVFFPETVLTGMEVQAQFWARVLLVTVAFIPVVIGNLAFFRSAETSAKFHEVLENFFRPERSWAWNTLVQKLALVLMSLSSFTEAFFEQWLFSKLWKKASAWIAKIFQWVETKLLDHIVLSGLTESVSTIGKSMRLIQNGQVQFYFALGCVVMAAVLLKFVFLGR